MAKTHHQSAYEFGGPVGAFCIIIFSHFLIYYLWISLQYYNGSLIFPSSLANIPSFCNQFLQFIAEGAAPNFQSFSIYGGFLFLQLLLAQCMPGIWVKGLPVSSEGNIQHHYLCNGVASWYVTLILIFILNYTGLFRLATLTELLGSLISTAILIADMLALGVFVLMKYKGQESRPSGNLFYDFFMGIILNPRLGKVDLKFFAEVRVAWIFLFILTLSAATKQYEQYHTLTWPMIFIVVAQGLYANACIKGEECIPTTWDIFHEKWGWMLIFWNFAGVPFVYSFQSLYILQNNPQYPFGYSLLLFIVLFAAYYVWDTSQSQKNRFRMQQRGTYIKRKSFPQLPWGTLKEPKLLKTTQGDALLIDGWWRYARKIHYFADSLMALTWGLCCGLGGILPYFYPLFFMGMIIHRYHRDSIRCAKKYGKDWEKYCQIVPYKFIPFIF